MSIELVEIYSGYLQMSKPLVLPLYNEEGLLLASKGTILNQEQFNRISGLPHILTPKSELIAELESIKLTNSYSTSEPDKPYRFPDIFSRLMKLEQQYLQLISVGAAEFEKGLLNIVRQLDALVQNKPDAVLARIFLRTARYASIEVGFATAVVGSLCARELEWRDEERHLLMCAALTLELGVLLKPGASTVLNVEPTREDIVDYDNISRSLALLIERGIDNAKWLNYVANHHLNDPRREHVQNETLDQSMSTNLMVSVHQYCQLVLGYGFEQPVFPDIILRYLLQTETGGFSRLFERVFCRAIGLYPAGSMLGLSSGEVVMVQKQSGDQQKPYVRILRDAQGRVVNRSLVRKLDGVQMRIRDMVFDAKLLREVDYSPFWQ